MRYRLQALARPLLRHHLPVRNGPAPVNGGSDARHHLFNRPCRSRPFSPFAPRPPLGRHQRCVATLKRENPMAITPTAVDVSVGDNARYVDWTAIFAGAVLASAISFVLFTFGAGLGLSLTSP